MQSVQIVLSSSTYAGTHKFNKVDSKTMKLKDEAEWIKIPVPAIIDQNTFDTTTKLREAWSPRKCVPQREASPNLLMGLLKCGHCGAAMSVVTGKSGRYKYYKCNARMSKGDMACASKNFPLETIDNLVLNAFKQTIYTTEHIRNIIDELRTQLTKSKDPHNAQRLKALEGQLKETEHAQTKLFEAVEKGVLDLDDQLKDRAKQHKDTRQKLLIEIAELKRQHQAPINILTPQKIETVAKVLQKRLTSPTPYSRAYLKATLSEIRITDQFLKLSGTRQSMAAIIANNGQIDNQNMVPNFIPEWRPLRPSNQCFMTSKAI